MYIYFFQSSTNAIVANIQSNEGILRIEVFSDVKLKKCMLILMGYLKKKIKKILLKQLCCRLWLSNNKVSLVIKKILKVSKLFYK